ncbi:hypothetical protein O6H91_02G102600 [Diphasiastrum complanatum]|uniref:Uncharacterized protein n=2 Tax=Diphasiastrum complanatum TaxID=34168 RepID=A0ACC2EIJ3_DIPCM|nr:hypothetical protein O6H91_02G102600 [Diphasiastrum complanatum]KAJ7566429.1 hypothetical protein O6H91_02G102600 [Diphasiastrum complanatum]
MNTFRPTGGKDRHLKVNTSKGTRDRRIRLSVSAAIQLYDIQDRLGYNQPSMAVEWLIKNAQQAISELAPLPSIALGVTSESHIPGTTAPSRVPSIDQYPRCKSFVDTYPLTGSLVPKENYDSGFTESTSRTFHDHVSSARPDLDDQTCTRDDECVPVRLLEQRISKDLPSCSNSEACEERDTGYSMFKTDSRTKARERARARAKVKSSLKMLGQKDIMSTRFMPSTRQLNPADNQLSCSVTYPKLLQSSQSTQDPPEKFAMSSLQNIALSPLEATCKSLKQDTTGNVSENLRSNEHRLMSSPLIDPLWFSHSRIPPQPQNVNEMPLGGSLDQTRLQLGSTPSDISLGCLQQGLSSSASTNVHGITSPFSVSYFPPRAVYPYLSTNSGHPIFQAITVNQLTALGLPIPNYRQQEVFSHSEVFRPPEFLCGSLTSGSTVYTSAPTNNSQEKDLDRINFWQGWPRAFGHGFNIDSSSTCNARTISQQRSFSPDPTVQLFSDMNRTLSPQYPTSSLNRQAYERERNQMMSSGRGTFRSLIEGTGTLDDVFDSESHSP